ncbi:hypothetical protein CJO75_24425 (plasmid) [Ralstonia solanacearum]|nr:hypothetical protein CJO75_24425 [Ralstonia solanacearum]
MGYACPPLGRHTLRLSCGACASGMVARSGDRVSEMGRPGRKGVGRPRIRRAGAADPAHRRSKARQARAAGCAAPRLPLS